MCVLVFLMEIILTHLESTIYGLVNSTENSVVFFFLVALL